MRLLRAVMEIVESDGIAGTKSLWKCSSTHLHPVTEGAAQLMVSYRGWQVLFMMTSSLAIFLHPKSSN